MNPHSRSNEIHEIASQSGLPEEEVLRLYEEAWQCLAADAQIQDYLPLLASKRVRQYLKDRYRAAESNSSFLKDYPRESGVAGADKYLLPQNVPPSSWA